MRWAASAKQGDWFTTQVKVCNQGLQYAWASVGVYLSEDAVITPSSSSSASPDVLAGFKNYIYLDRGKCQTVNVSIHAQSAGTFYLGAVADPQNTEQELSESNNSLAGSRIGIGDAPDFVVSAVTGPTSALPGQVITTAVTVCNQGVFAGGTHVRVYLSDDTIITPESSLGSTPDYFLGDGFTNYLNPGQCQTLSIDSWNAWPLPEGRFYLGAVAGLDDYSDEILLDNNSLAGNRIGLGSKPDFIVSAATGPTSAQRDNPFTASVTVCNQGTATGWAYAALYLSKDEIITPDSPFSSSPDFSVGAEPISSDLGPGQCQTLQVSAWALVPPGTYYLGAAIDSTDDDRELFTDNNTRMVAQFTVTP